VHIERDNPFLEMALNHPLLQAGKRLLQKHELPVVLETKPSCTEAGMYQYWGVPAFVFGPGESGGNVHAPNESIELSQIEKAIEVYASAIEAFCVKGE
jgi:acetylornithine deacetylase/succinyl-diaminopimelate desuccinylase-like protein